MSPKGKHAPASPSSFYASLARHAAAAVAVVVVVAMVIAMATREDDGTPVAGPTTSPSASVDPSVSPSATAEPTEEPTTREPRARQKITITVLNGAGRSGLASQTQERIVQAGFTVPEVDNAQPRAKTVIFYRKGFEPEAQLLLDDFPDLLRIKPAGKNTEVSGETMLTVILGDDYRT